jgi:MbtH protein
MSSNPFDNEDGVFLVLVNAEGQYSLWPDFVDVPAGWEVAHPRGTRQECLQFVEDNWRDMRPRSLAEAMDGPDAQ